jgi:uncharacterized protein YdaU (DUF1376 family)
MKEKAPHMPWYGREFYSDENVMVMTLEQEAAYLRLLWNCWQEGSVPSDIPKLAALAKNTVVGKFERSVWPALREMFMAREDGRLTHQKVEFLRAAKEDRRKASSEGGRLGNEKRWGKGDAHNEHLPMRTVWRQLLLPISDNYFSPSATTTILTNF